MPHPDWNQRYEAGETPWDTGEPDESLVELVRDGDGSAERGRALDVGCGTGTHALWLAAQGFAVLGIDVSTVAIERARAKKGAAAPACRFTVADFLRDGVSGGPFDLIFDRGCFHLFDEPEDRARFAERAASLLGPDGRWLSLIGSTEGPDRDSGPPRRSARDVIGAIEPALELVELRSIQLRGAQGELVAAWRCLVRRRAAPAQPSTRRG
ncbi:MAG: class I SAM-dependent methyltransferase [Steroidobacteraceae bacterium]